jgi:hypothetical protein
VVKILARDGENLVEVPTEARDGLAAVDIKPNQEFAILIENPTEEFLGVNVALDGINMFAFSENPGYRQLGKIAIEPGSPGKPHTAILKGWHRIGDNSTAFRVTNYGDSAAAKLGVNKGVGTITITFYRGILVPGAKGETPSHAIGFGSQQKMVYKDVPVRFTDILGAVSVRYLRPTPPPDLPQE